MRGVPVSKNSLNRLAKIGGVQKTGLSIQKACTTISNRSRIGVGRCRYVRQRMLSYYESTVAFDAYILEQDNPALREYVSELLSALENRAILRILRLQASQSAAGTGTPSNHQASVA